MTTWAHGHEADPMSQCDECRRLGREAARETAPAVLHDVAQGWGLSEDQEEELNCRLAEAQVGILQRQANEAAQVAERAVSRWRELERELGAMRSQVDDLRDRQTARKSRAAVPETT